MASIKQILNVSGFQTKQRRALEDLFNAVLAETNVIAAKLDADVGVTDTDYAATLAASTTPLTE